MLRTPRLIWLFLLCILNFSILAIAQQSGLVGTVSDPTGAVLVGVNVTAKNVDTAEIRQATTNEVGQYAMPNLRVGVYEVSAEKQGFQKKVVEHVALEVQAT